MDLSIIIVNWNAEKLLRDCLTSVFKHTKNLVYEIFVVDNGSTDGSVKTAQKFKKVKLIQNKKNLGFSKANNQAIKKAKGEFILLLNSDTKLTENAFLKLVSFARSQPSLGIVGPQLINPGNLIQPSAGRFLTLPVVFFELFGLKRWTRQAPKKTSRVDWVEGSCFLIKRQVIKKIGLLDEKFFMYVEEMEFCYRAAQAGWQTWYYPKTKVHHLVRGSSPEGKQKAVAWIYEGLVYFYQKHFSSWQLTMLKCLVEIKKAYAKILKLV